MWVVKERQKSKVMARLLSWAQEHMVEAFTAKKDREQRGARFCVR